MNFLKVGFKPLAIFLLLLFPLSACSSLKAATSEKHTAPLLMAEKMQEAKKGDYFVFLKNKTYTLFHILDLEKKFLTLEEWVIAQDKFDPLKLTWSQWVEKKAPRNSSWVIYEFDLQQGLVTEIYSVSRASHLSFHASQSFFSTLLHIPFTPLAEKSRKKLGSAASQDKKYSPTLWQPPLMFQGTSQGYVSFDAYRGIWPQDSSELSGYELEIYFPAEKGPYPHYFPYWLQLSNGLQNLKYRVMDSGTMLYSSSDKLPRRLPSFIHVEFSKKPQLRFHLELSRFHRPFEMLLMPEGEDLQESLSIPYTLHSENSREVIGELDPKTLKKIMKAGVHYRLYILSQGQTPMWIPYQNSLAIN